MNVALIMAGGMGTRMGADCPKQYMLLAKKPVIVYTLEAFQIHKEVDAIAVVCAPTWRDALMEWAARYRIAKLRWFADAGESRSASVRSGLETLQKHTEDADIVLVHDAVRPFVPGRVISDCIAAVRRYGACGTVVPASDTIVTSSDGKHFERIPPRAQMFQCQTPQGFRMDVIDGAHRTLAAMEHPPDVTDDCGAVMATGGDVVMVRGDDRLFKITSPQDMRAARAYLYSIARETE
nr:2-C-methyl-D-erythritol 4-phosphate cytidylyltransferase [Maliibacterium massiliense]